MAPHHHHPATDLDSDYGSDLDLSPADLAALDALAVTRASTVVSLPAPPSHSSASSTIVSRRTDYTAASNANAPPPRSRFTASVQVEYDTTPIGGDVYPDRESPLPPPAPPLQSLVRLRV